MMRIVYIASSSIVTERDGDASSHLISPRSDHHASCSLIETEELSVLFTSWLSRLGCFGCGCLLSFGPRSCDSCNDFVCIGHQCIILWQLHVAGGYRSLKVCQH